MNEIVPGVFHWKAKHPNIGADVSCYYLAAERVLIDPMQPEEGLDWFRENGPPEHILLSNRHHDRDSAAFVEAFGCTVHASRPGMHEFSDDQKVEPFDFGDELPGGVKAYEAGAICPDDTALHIPAHSALSVADGVINYGGLGFVPEEHLGDHVDATKKAIRDSYARIAADAEFDNLLVAHGEPIVGGAGEQMRAFVEG
jgi:glyoxylase-like metal-dependent hydrolase (beta-lactamase superfamily II)